MLRKLGPFRWFFLLLITLFLAAVPVRATVTVLSYWHMGEHDPGAVSGGRCNSTVDSVGGDTLAFAPESGHYPYYTNGVAASAAQQTGSSLGVAITNGEYGTAAVVTTAGDNFGIECWVNPGTNNTGSQILAYNGLRGNGWGIYQNGTNFEGLFGGEIFFGAGTAIATPGTWIHLALVRNNGDTTLYTNGVPVSTTAEAPLTPSTSFTVGGDAQFGDYFTGVIDEVRVFTFTAGQFSTNDLLYFQTPPGVYNLASTNYNEGASAGTDTVVLTTSPANAVWTATANATWLHLPSTSGVGNSNILFGFDDNPGVPRKGTLTIADQSVTVSQGQATLSFPLSYTGFYGCDFMEIPASGGATNVPMTVTPNVGQWTCSASANWIHVQTASGTGSTDIAFTADPNTNGTVRWNYDGVSFDSAEGPFRSVNTKFLVYQQASTPGPGQATYQFTGHLIPYLPQDAPANASAALLSVASNDVFYLTMTLVTGAPVVYSATYACGVNNITFSVPSRGLVYSASFEDFEVLDEVNSPNELRWGAANLDSTVGMIFWADDLTSTALANGDMPNPLNLTGFHSGESFSQIFLINGNGENPTLFMGDLVPMPTLNITPQPGTNVIWWVTSDATYTPVLQSTTSLTGGSDWQTVTNAPVTLGLTNSVALPESAPADQFFRLKIL
ncbi:MAG TPA: LamG-like jellyroll fold domain-containing protein [Verrucomicrobiae bacterium]|nr:LamG-like jellyroll fold domain-containing protein [Verrucomicrobiae bacterium]